MTDDETRALNQKLLRGVRDLSREVARLRLAGPAEKRAVSRAAIKELPSDVRIAAALERIADALGEGRRF